MRSVFALALAATIVAAQSDAPPLVVKARNVWVSPSTVRENAAVVIERGMITSIESSKKQDWPEGAEVLDFPQGTVTAGLVLALYRPAASNADPVDAVTPAALGADVLDPFEPQPKLVRGGVTVAGIAAGADRLVSGQGSAVRIGAPPDLFVLKRSCCLRANVGEGPRKTPDLFRPPVLPGPDDPLLPATPQEPKTRAGAIAELRSLLERAKKAAGDAAWRPREGEDDLRPFIRVLNAGLPLQVAADRYADVARAIELARDFRVKLVIEGGNEAWKLAKELKAIDAAVILRVAPLPPVGTSAQAPYFRAAGEGNPDAASLLKAAGVTVALIPPADSEAGNLAYHATRAMGPDFGWNDALAAITLNPAKILGVDADVGTLATGRRADLLVWPGDGFEISSRPVLVIAGGRVAQRVKPRDDLIAITVKRVHTCAGDALDGATVLVEGGKIRAVGQHVTIPYDARRIVEKDAVIVPGFIDGGGQVGIRGYQVTGEEVIEAIAPVGPLGMEQAITKFFDPDMPAVVAAANAGVTAVALTPGGGRMTCGSLAVVKTSGPSKDRVVRAVGGVLFDLGGQPPNEATRKSIDSMLEAGKKYADSFTEYEKALAEWKKGQKTGPQAREKIEGAKGAKPRDPVSGTWTGKATMADDPHQLAFTITMKLEGTNVTGTFKMAMGGREGREREMPFTGTFEGGVLKIKTTQGRIQIEVEATIGRDVLTGVVRLGPIGELQIEATRTEGAAGGDESRPADKKDDAKKEEVDDGRPKPPKDQPALDPYRELFADRASAFVACPSEALCDIALDLFRTKYDLRTVIVTTADIVTLAPRIGASGAALAPTAASIREEEGVLINPAFLGVQNKAPVFFRSGHDGDPRSLYGIAEAAVRDGVDPEDALRMVTRQPARFLGSLDRLGSLERGKDADLVLLTGEPFAPGTRVKRVMVGGKFVDEEGETALMPASKRSFLLALSSSLFAQAPADAAASAPAPEARIAVVHGRVFPVTAPPIDDGVVVTKGKKIEAVGKFGSVEIPAGAQIIDATGLWVIPGIIEMHNHTGASDLHDIVFQVNPELRVVDNVQFRTASMKTAVAGGITTLLTIPGSGTNMGGFGVVMKTWGRTPADVVVRFPGALKIAQAGNPERFGGELGHGRMGMNWLIRNVLIEGREYNRAWEAYEKGETKTAPPKNLRYEMLRGLFRKEYPIAVHTQWFQVVQSSIRILKKELDLDPIVDHGEWEGYMNTPELVKYKIPVAAGPRAYDYDQQQARFLGIPAAYYWRGIDQDSIGVNTDSPVVPQEELPYQVAMAIRLGLPEDVALKGVTINAARMLKLEKRLGSLEPGKDADIAVWTGDPFDPRRRTQVVIIDGDVAYDVAKDGIRF